MDTNKCVICGRELGGVMIEDHHLIPRSRKGKDTIKIHRICHQKIHATFTNAELERYYNTPDRILEHPDIQVFVAWVQKKSLDFYNKNQETVNKKSKRR